MIVDLLRNDIGRVAQPGSVRVPELFVVEPFPAVHHLVSTITATLPEQASATELLRACFPGGSITGAPKVRAMEIIEELEPQRRNAYCGSIGYLSACGTMDTNITIRTLVTENGRIHCSAGGGIVADSQEQAEYQETFDKVGRILPQLGSAPCRDPIEFADLTARLYQPFSTAAAAGGADPHNVRPAAVLIPIVCRAEPTLLLTRRADSLRKHAGQVAFPGGKTDAEDGSAIVTALREAQEEVAIPPNAVTVLGQMAPLDSSTGFQVTPIVGLIPPDVQFHANEGEVADVFEMPLRKR